MYSAADHNYMRRAIELAAQGQYTTHPNPNVGCVVVKDGHIVGEGWHHKAGEPHAEVHALRAAGEAARGATAYVTLEPCSHYGRTPPCALALKEAGISRVVSAMQDPNPLVAGRGLHLLSEAGVVTQCGLLHHEAEQLNPGFIKRMQSGLPWVRVKLAASLDGRTALANGRSQWITGSAARRDVQQWRARSSAILSGADTVLIDDPSLNVRWCELPDEVQATYPESVLRQPLRVLLDSQQRINPSARLFGLPGEVLLVRHQTSGQSLPDNVNELLLPLGRQGKMDLSSLLYELGAMGCNELWVEAGAQLAGALLDGGWVDEFIVYLAPKLLGPDAKPLVNIPLLSSMADTPTFALHSVCQIGEDVRLILQPQRKES